MTEKYYKILEKHKYGQFMSDRIRKDTSKRHDF